MEIINHPKYVLIINGDSYVELWNDRRVIFGHSEEWGEYRYNLLSEVGEMWKIEIDQILSAYSVKLSKLDTPEEYSNIWESFNVDAPEGIMGTSEVVWGILGIALICAFFTVLLFMAVFAASWN